MSNMRDSLECKVSNMDLFYNECKSRLNSFTISDKRIRLFVSTSIIMETAMLRAYAENGMTNSNAICKLYDNGILNMDYQKITTSIREVRNSIIHMNVSIEVDILELKFTIKKMSSRKFKQYIDDLFGEYNKFTDRELRDLHEMLASPLGIDILKLDADEMFNEY